MGLSECQAHRQIKHMLTFIYQEANEKVQEIDAKAEEEFNIEKGRLVQQERLKIMEFYDKKEKQIEIQKRIQFSKMLYQNRLNVLRFQDSLVQEVLDETRQRLGDVTNDTKKYSNVLKNLILQALFQVFETPILIRVREMDEDLIEVLLPEIAKTYEDASKKGVYLKIDTVNYLPECVSGGVEIYALDGRIRIDNTLESRFSIVSAQLIPQIRRALFGPNLNRKFDD
ncbi:hypothetical protein FQR65_LT07959 [Abscondita terminalis]|nr:hypothetical protein FQR65_LT07959 [Abscondita terminalis]